MVKIKRIFKGKLKRVENFLLSIVDEMDRSDVALLKGALKRYYAFHCSGVHPHGLIDADGYEVLEGDTSISIMIALENKVNGVFLNLFKKYNNNCRRSAYIRSKIVKKLSILYRHLKTVDVHSAANYSSKYVKCDEILSDLEKLNEMYSSLSSNFNTRLKLSYAKPLLLNEGLWKEEHQAVWEEIITESIRLSKEVNVILNNMVI